LARNYQGARAYEKFWGRHPRYTSRVKWNPPKQLIYLGKAVSIIYENNKFNGGGDGKVAHYKHDFETPCFLYMDQTAKRQLYIIGNRLKVTEAGIEN